MRMRRVILIFGLLLLTACGSAAVPATPTSIPTIASTETPQPTETPVPPTITPTIVSLDNFEAATTNWVAGTEAFFSDSSAVSLALTGEHASSGKQALQLNFDQNDKPKAIFFLDALLDLSQGRYLKFDIFNPGRLSTIGIAMLSGPDKVWYESDGIGAAEGASVTLSFDLASATYKAASTNWEFSAAIADLNTVSRLAIIVYPAKSGSIFIDNIRLSDQP
jgi:hypothetical protein